MGVYIKGMEMPKTCEDCQFHRYHSHHEYVCVATPLFYPMNLANSEGIRKDWCPLVEVQKPHESMTNLDDAIRLYETMAAREWTNEVTPAQLVEWLKELRFRRQLDKVLAAYKEDQEGK